MTAMAVRFNFVLSGEAVGRCGLEWPAECRTSPLAYYLSSGSVKKLYVRHAYCSSVPIYVKLYITTCVVTERSFIST